MDDFQFSEDYVASEYIIRRQIYYICMTPNVFILHVKGFDIVWTCVLCIYCKLDQDSNIPLNENW